MLPNKNPKAPKIADAVLALARAESIARAVATVKESPIMKHSVNSSPSKMTMEAPALKVINRARLHRIMPRQLTFRQSCWETNLTETPEPRPIATALAAKNRLKAKGLYP